MATKRIPYGISDFQLLASDDYYYVDKTRFIEEIAERSPLQKERLMTIAERLRQEGHQIGWQEGMHEQAIKIALRMLEQGIDRDQVLAATQLSEADLAANNH